MKNEMVAEVNFRKLRTAWLIFGLIILVINVPNIIPWEKNLYPESYLFDLQERLLKCALLSAMFLSVFRHAWCAWGVSWIVFLWWLPGSIAVRWLNESPVTANLVGMAFASSPGELQNLLASIPQWLLWVFLGWNVFCLVSLKFLKNTEVQWAIRTRFKIFLLCFFLLGLPYLIGFLRMDRSVPVSPPLASANNPDPFQEGDREIGMDGAFPRAFPYELPWALAQYMQAKRVVDGARFDLKPASLMQKLVVQDKSPEIVVLVIGESSSRSAWHLFNSEQYTTTPYMDKRLIEGRGLYQFSNVVAQSVATRQAVPSMLTSQPLLWPDGSPNSNATESIVALAGRAGYETAWFSNQAAIGQFDGVIAAYASEANATSFLNPSSFSQPGTYDEVLLPPLKRHISQKGRSLVVLHTMGSHFKFEQRYPRGFGPFPDSSSMQESYFNSIAYTDLLLERVISILEMDGRSALMLYVSDHGQGLPDEKCKKTVMNRSTAESYEVPALLWLSKEYERKNPGIPERLLKNSAVPYTTAIVHQSLSALVAGKNADPSGISYSVLSSHPSQPQLVATPDSSTVNFNEAADRNPCFIRAN